MQSTKMMAKWTRVIAKECERRARDLERSHGSYDFPREPRIAAYRNIEFVMIAAMAAFEQILDLEGAMGQN